MIERLAGPVWRRTPQRVAGSDSRGSTGPLRCPPTNPPPSRSTRRGPWWHRAPPFPLPRRDAGAPRSYCTRISIKRPQAERCVQHTERRRHRGLLRRDRCRLRSAGLAGDRHVGVHSCRWRPIPVRRAAGRGQLGRGGGRRAPAERARHLPFGLPLHDTPGDTWRARISGSQLISDESVAFALSRPEGPRGPRRLLSLRHIAPTFAWDGGTAVGVLLAGSVDDSNALGPGHRVPRWPARAHPPRPDLADPRRLGAERRRRDAPMMILSVPARISRTSPTCFAAPPADAACDCRTPAAHHAHHGRCPTDRPRCVSQAH